MIARAAVAGAITLACAQAAHADDQQVRVYLDVGGFVAGGDGSGVRPDIGHRVFSEYATTIPAEWVLMGDPLSTAINARGEPADLGLSRAITEDGIDSEGRPAFILNTLGLQLTRDITDDIRIRAWLVAAPRSGADVLEVELAHVEWRPARAPWLRLFAGRIDSVLGVEYRWQAAPERLEVTPSLICRYTCGRPIGVQARATWGAWTANLSIAEGDSFVAQFEPRPQLVSDSLPTASARFARKLPYGVEVGVSGSLGPRTGPPDRADAQWHAGVDARLDYFEGFEARAEVVHGVAPGSAGEGDLPCASAACLRYSGAYVLLGYHVSNTLEPYLRVDWRDALHRRGADYVYVSKVARATIGLHVSLADDRIGAKVEYTWNRELGRIPEFPDDVFTTSLVVATD